MSINIKEEEETNDMGLKHINAILNSNVLKEEKIINKKKDKMEECIELKNIKYKTMMMNRKIIETKISDNFNNLELFLEEDKNNIQNEIWSKMDKTQKIKKVILFAEAYAAEKLLEIDEKEILVTFLKDCLDRKKLQRVKEVEYDKETGTITEIPALFYNKLTKHFTLKNMDKRVSTLKSLPPKRINSTIKNKVPTTKPSIVIT